MLRDTMARTGTRYWSVETTEEIEEISDRVKTLTHCSDNLYKMILQKQRFYKIVPDCVDVCCTINMKQYFNIDKECTITPYKYEDWLTIQSSENDVTMGEALPVTKTIDPTSSKTNCFHTDIAEEMIKSSTPKHFLANLIKNRTINIMDYDKIERLAQILIQDDDYQSGLMYAESQTLREWQLQLYEMISEKSNARTVVWIYDPVGNSGKTWFTDWVGKRFPE